MLKKQTLIGNRFWEKVNIRGPDECWPWLDNRHGNRYGRFRFNGKTEKAHRVAWLLTYGDIPGDLCVLHKCDDGFCVNPSHLFLGTHTDNMHDMIKKGRAKHTRGEAHPRARLTEDDVREIVRLASIGNLTQGEVAGRFGVSQVRISQILLGRGWNWVTGIDSK